MLSLILDPLFTFYSPIRIICSMSGETLTGAVEGAATGKLSRISDVGDGFIRVETPWEEFTLNIPPSTQFHTVIEVIDPNAAFVMPIRTDYFTADYEEARTRQAVETARHGKGLMGIFPIIEGDLPEEQRRPEVLRVATYPPVTF